MSTNSELASIKNTLETLETFDGTLPGTEAALSLIQTAITNGAFDGTLPGTEAALSLIQTAITNGAFDGTLPGTENALSLIRGDIQANTNALLCMCEALRNNTVFAPGDNPLFPTPPPTTINDPVTNPPPTGDGWTLCKAAYAYIEFLAALCDKIVELANTPIWSFMALVSALVGGIVILISGGTATAAVTMALTATGLWGIIKDLSQDGIIFTFESLANELRTNTELRSCLGSAFLSGSTTAMSTAVDNKLSDPTLALILKTLITQDMIDKFTNGMDVDGTLVWPQADDADGCDCVAPMGCLECVSGHKLTKVTGENISISPVSLFNSTCSVSRNGDRFTITGITATSTNYSEYWISAQLAITGGITGTLRGLLFNVVSASANVNSVRIVAREWDSCFATNDAAKLIDPYMQITKNALVGCWDFWHNSYGSGSLPLSQNMWFSSGGTGGLPIEIVFDVYMIETC